MIAFVSYLVLAVLFLIGAAIANDLGIKVATVLFLIAAALEVLAAISNRIAQYGEDHQE